MLSICVFAFLLLVLICGTVALLLFARAATRETELIVRSALGASRSRIIAQLFAEALVRGSVAAVVGLAAAHVALSQWGLDFLEGNLGRLPLWYDPRLSPVTVLYASGLAVVGAVIAGVGPALKVTRGLGSRLRQDTAGGGGLRFGRVWTAVIVTQVAVTVAFSAVVFVEQQELRRIRSFDIGFPAEEHLGVRLEMEATTGSDADTEPAQAAQPRAFRGVDRGAAQSCRGDMWDAHHCLSAAHRVAEMAPRVNDVLGTLRERGALIIHARPTAWSSIVAHRRGIGPQTPRPC